ncbi:hypothetical protein [Pseudomonas savastanoi]|uniref:hypothetical protein n=1 Tax=Pseudomonas savastanoi TaxID=29438 RepID=UPI000E327DCE|nr:hypothetical protein [Pseudomonas savastanoi]
MRMAQYTVQVQNDMMIVITDDDVLDLPSITNSAAEVISHLNSRCGGLGARRVYYRDTIGRFDELRHQKGVFLQFSPCKPSQQESFKELLQR